MKRSLPLRSVLFLVVSAALAVTAFSFSDAEWKFRQDFVLERGSVIRVAVPLETLDHTQPNLGDLRIQDRDGNEVPYALIRPSSTPARSKRPEDFEVELENEATIINIDAGENKVWESIDFIVRTSSFLKAARIEASSNGEAWQQWGDGVPIFRKTEAEQTQLSLRKEPARYFRVTLNDRRTPPIIVTGAQLREPALDQISLEPIALRITRTDDYARETALTLELPAANLDLDSLEIMAAEGLFTRQVRAGVRQFREGEIEERNLASDTIFRINVEDTPRIEKNRAFVGATIPTRELVLHLENGDSPPLHIDQIKSTRRVVYLAFDARQAGRYTLWSGNPQVSAPQYDLAPLTDSLRKLSLAKPVFETVVINPNYHHADPLAGLSLTGTALTASEWSHRRGVQVNAPGVQLLELDLSALSTAQPSLSDLRLVSGDKQVPYILERTRLARTTDLVATLESDSKKPSVSTWRVRLPYAAPPFSQLSLTTSAALFQREIRIFERRQTNKGESYEADLGSASWQRTPHDPAKPLLIGLAPVQGSELWIQTENGDNPPIALENVRAYYPVNRLLFRTETTGNISLLSGNPSVASPRYDLSLVAQTLLSSEKKIAGLATPAAVEANDHAPSALSIKTALFWAALALVVVALLVVVAKLLPKPPSEK